MKFSVFQVSRRGGRQKNEDRMGYCYTRESGLFVLADGMGGHPEGEVAAQLALQTVSSLYQKLAQPQLDDPSDFLARSLMTAHRRLLGYASEKGMLDTPRTTLVAAVLQNNCATWLHCGDSRLYLVRDGDLGDPHPRPIPTPSRCRLGGRPAGGRSTATCCSLCPGLAHQAGVRDIMGPVPLLAWRPLVASAPTGCGGSIPDADIVRQLGAGERSRRAVPEMVEQALRKAGETSDNVTVLALEWEMPEAFVSTHGVSTDTAGDGVFASTIQANFAEEPVDDMDDAAIERSIAEINEAIRRFRRAQGVARRTPRPVRGTIRV